MNDRNELNDIILNKNSSGTKSKKLVLAIAALTLLLIIILVTMNTLKSSNPFNPNKLEPVQPSAPKEIVEDPVFEPVEVIEEGNTEATNSETNLDEIAQKIKNGAVPTATTPPSTTNQNLERTTVAATPVKAAAPKVIPTPIINDKPASKQTAAVESTPTNKQKNTLVTTPTKSAQKNDVKPAKAMQEKPAITKETKEEKPKPLKKAPETKKVEESKSLKSTATPAKKDIKPEVTKVSKTDTEVKKAATTKESVPVAKTKETFYIQVGSFTKSPNKALIDRLNGSGMKYTTTPSGAITKILVGPFSTEKQARDVLGSVRNNVEAGAYLTKE